MQNYFPQSIDEYIELFARRRKFFLVPFLGILALTALVYPLLPRAYESTALVQVQDRGMIDPLTKGLVVNTSVEKKLQSLSSEILSWPQLIQLVQQVGLAGKSNNAGQLEKAAQNIKDRVRMEMIGSDVLEIGFEGRSPQTAQKVVDFLTKNLMTAHHRMRRQDAERAIHFIEEQLKVYKGKMQTTESSYLQNKIRVDLNEAVKRRELLADHVHQLERSLARSGSGGDPVAGRLRQELADAEVQLNQLLLDSKRTHPMIDELRQRIADLRGRLRASRSSEGFSEDIVDDTNPVYQQARMEMKTLDLTIRTLEKRQADLEAGGAKAKNISESELQAIERDRQVNEDIYKSLQARLQNALISRQLDQEGEGGSFKVLQEARLPSVPSSPKPLGVAGLGLLAGLIGGAASLILREYFDTSFRGVHDAKDFLKLPLLGAIPTMETGEISPALSGAGRNGHGTPAPPLTRKDLEKMNGHAFVHKLTVVRDPALRPQVVAFHDPGSILSEQYRLLRTHLVTGPQDRRLQTLLLTSTREAEGKTTTSVNLAVSMAQELNGRTLLLDADLRKGQVAQNLGLAGKLGLSDVLSGRAGLEAALHACRVDRLTVLPAGTPERNSTGLLASDTLVKMMDVLRRHYDHIIVDAPPVLSLADVPVLVPLVDGVMLVVQMGRTRREMAQEAVSILQQTEKGKVVGFVLTHVDHYFPGYFQQYFASKYYYMAGGA